MYFESSSGEAFSLRVTLIAGTSQLYDSVGAKGGGTTYIVQHLD